MYNYLYNSLWDNPEQLKVIADKNSGVSLDGGSTGEVTVTAYMPPKPKKATIPNPTYTVPDTKIPFEPMRDYFSKRELRTLDRDTRWATRVINRNNRRAERELRQQNNLEKYGNKMGMSDKWQHGLSSIGSITGAFSGNELPESDKAVREGIRSTIGQIGPWGAIISAATGVVDTIGDLTGTNLDTIDLNAAKRAGVKGGAIFNKVMNMLPGNSMLWGIYGGDTNAAQMSSDSIEMAGGYSGTIGKMNDAQALGSKRMLFGKNKANQFINSANKMNETLTDMNIERKRMESNYAPQLIAANNQMIFNGYTPGLTLHKHGGTIPELDEVRSIMQSLQSKKQEIQEPQKFQLGGKMNMIVTGALHARKHNLEELNPNLEGEITKKGIPVVVMNEGGEVQSQQAEVESGEIIMNFDTTKTIEDYYEEYNSTDSKTEKNKIALECGKYLVNELLKNTDDPDKLIKQVV